LERRLAWTGSSIDAIHAAVAPQNGSRLVDSSAVGGSSGSNVWIMVCVITAVQRVVPSMHRLARRKAIFGQFRAA